MKKAARAVPWQIDKNRTLYVVDPTGADFGRDAKQTVLAVALLSAQKDAGVGIPIEVHVAFLKESAAPFLFVTTVLQLLQAGSLAPLPVVFIHCNTTSYDGVEGLSDLRNWTSDTIAWKEGSCNETGKRGTRRAHDRAAKAAAERGVPGVCAFGYSMEVEPVNILAMGALLQLAAVAYEGRDIDDVEVYVGGASGLSARYLAALGARVRLTLSEGAPNRAKGVARVKVVRRSPQCIIPLEPLSALRRSLGTVEQLHQIERLAVFSCVKTANDGDILILISNGKPPALV
jgi:hypothetical protein